MNGPARGGFPAACAVATLLGFVSLSWEIVWVRVYGVASAGAAATFGLFLGAYLAGIALGAAVSRRACRGDAPHRALRATAFAMIAANTLAFLSAPAIAEGVRALPYAVTLPLVGTIAGLLGAGLPLAAHHGVAPDGRAGERLSLLYVGNIAGSASGSLLTGFVLMEAWPLRTIALFLALAGLLACAPLIVLARFEAPLRRALLGALLLAAIASGLACPLLFDRIYEKLSFQGSYHGQRFTRVIETRSGVVTATADGAVYGGGAYDGMLRVDPVTNANGITRAYALAALHANPRHVLMIGLGAGAWAQVVAHMPGVESLTVVEINHGYLELVRGDPVVGSLLTNPKVSIVIDDGRRWMNRNPRRFDLIVQNTTHHRRAHVTNLVSVEYLDLVRRHLAPGGLFLTNATRSEKVERTAAIAFPFAWRYLSCVIAGDTPFEPDLAAWRRSLLAWRIDGAPLFDAATPDHRRALDRILERADWEPRAALLERTRGATVITDANMASEF